MHSAVSARLMFHVLRFTFYVLPLSHLPRAAILAAFCFLAWSAHELSIRRQSQGDRYRQTFRGDDHRCRLGTSVNRAFTGASRDCADVSPDALGPEKPVESCLRSPCAF